MAFREWEEKDPAVPLLRAYKRKVSKVMRDSIATDYLDRRFGSLGFPEGFTFPSLVSLCLFDSRGAQY